MSASIPVVLTIPKETLIAQQKACDPESSVWVSANAGSGKTFVLARRVIRLLLNGSDPSKILCLTFTKAAAAEMKTRVFNELGAWTSLPDPALDEKIRELVGHRPNATLRASARKLFARALETPGGLKIQTIHAFCQALLHQFPFEANVAGHFSVIDEREQDGMLTDALNAVLIEAASSPDLPLGRALISAVGIASDDAARQAVNDMVRKREMFRRWIEVSDNIPDAIAKLGHTLGLQDNETIPAVVTGIINSPVFSWRFIEELVIDLTASGAKSDKDLVARFEAAQTIEDDQARVEAWFRIFYSGSDADKPRAWSRFCTKAVKEKHPDLEDLLHDELARLDILRDRYRSMLALEATEAIVRLSDSVIGRYEHGKNARGLLDYDDLVLKTVRLLGTQEAAQWVQFKLDQGIDHILVDEAQDTSPPQWDVVRALTDEFFAGQGAREAIRTLFAVGDEKQSIYSFQGAAPDKFALNERHFRKLAEKAGANWHSLKLNLSFRSTPDVLKSVDQVFDDPDVLQGLALTPEKLVHEAIRRNDPGHVELWPVELTEAVEVDDDWTQPVDHIGNGNGLTKLAERIALTIRDWLAEGQRLAGTGERIRPGDILVLVRKRGAFVEALNRALKEQGLPIAGADRLSLADHIVVEDLLALGDIMLLPEDDLTLATVLKSPLIGFSENDLYELAQGRPRTLWQALGARAKNDQGSIFAKAYKTLNRWRMRIDFDRPFEFYARALGEDGGRRAILGQLGMEAEDVLDEFLNLALSFEAKDAPSLQAFLTSMRESGAEIKRELDQSRNEIRVMTVHGAKGLESPVVFLVDSGAAPVSAAHDPSILSIGDEEGMDGLLWAPRKAVRPGLFSEKLEISRQKAAEEYRRLLYVGMTRARDRLIVTAYGNKKEPHENCWYSLICNALEPRSEPLVGSHGEGHIWRATHLPAVPDKETELAEDDLSGDLPEWAAHPARSETKPPRPLAASALDDADFSETERAFSPQTGLTGAERGTLIHHLLEFLPALPKDEQRERGLAYLLRNPVMGDQEAGHLISQVLGMMDREDLLPFFSSEARAEVPVIGVLEGEKGEMRIAGRIDRMVIQGDEILILDYKTNRNPPSTRDEIPPAYQAQLSAYARLLKQSFKGKTVRAYLYWTETTHLMELDQSMLDQAFESWVKERKTRLDGADTAT